MKRWHSYFYHFVIFIFAQLAWLTLVSLWIYWYVSNYIIFSQVGHKLSPQMIPESRNVFALVSGLVLLVTISVAMSLLFRRLIVQYHLTGLYDNFIANVTHELKSPLASIQLYLETMDRHNLPWAKQKEFLAQMLKDSERLHSLINSILEIPALENKKIAHQFTVEDADSLVRQLIVEAREQFKQPAEAIFIEGTAPFPCAVDINAMRIVLFNLIENGIKYRMGPFHMTVTLATDAKNIILSLKDQGIGIPAEEAKNVFKKFYRIYNQDSPNVKGTGLGLYWVKEIIKYHGGTVSLSSEGKLKGTTFRITLPRYDVSKRRYIEKLIKQTQLKMRGKVDDEQNNRTSRSQDSIGRR
jgi:two-component system, OmpR family, phosphate regulon sensor histidine kinase PhoR